MLFWSKIRKIIYRCGLAKIEIISDKISLPVFKINLLKMV
jgi:hypothetical protein